MSVIVNRRGAVLEVILDRPKVNAIDAATSKRLGEVFAELRDDDALRAATITGAGDRIFSAGWDIKSGVEEGEGEDADFGQGGFAGLTELFDLNKPVIAAVNGIAIGGGVELMLACDLVVTAEHATFSLPEVALGVMADAGGVQRLPRRLPHCIAMEMLMLGRPMSAAEAARWGLVNRVVAPRALMSEVRSMADALAGGAPLSLQAIKEVVRGTQMMSVAESFQAMRAGHFPTYRRMLDSEDRREGPLAFMEKRRPNFTGQ